MMIVSSKALMTLTSLILMKIATIWKESLTTEDTEETRVRGTCAAIISMRKELLPMTTCIR